jgi:DNA-directed RNA polymerase specialized sigma24 family protein
MQFSNHKRRQDRLNWLAEMYRVYAADLQHFISYKVGDPTVAEDLTSTVFRKRAALAQGGSGHRERA